MKKIVILVILLLSYLPNIATSKVSDAKMIRQIDSLMSLMTLEEKLGQLNLLPGGDLETGQKKSLPSIAKIRNGLVGGIFNIKGVDKIRELQRIAIEESRLGIPLIFGMDVIHGYETVFPIPLALAATWNMEAIERSAQIAASEASADGIFWTFSPVGDVCRDPRWGRIAESPGEDPYLGGEIVKAMVYGYQGRDDLYASNRIMACIKHFALYGASEAGRDYNPVDMSFQRMYNDYLYPYKAAIDAGVGSVMASFNEINGIPSSINKWLLTDLLRTQWKFDGFVVSDYTSINETVDHGIGDLQTVATLALKAGLDMDMVGESYLNTLPSSLAAGKVVMEQINTACRRILKAKYLLGLFENPYKFCNSERARNEIYTQSNREEARKIAAESFVLLKNEGVLPLRKQGKIAIIGPLADTRVNMVGTWSLAADPSAPATLLEGIRSVAGDNVEILYAKGANLTRDAVLQARATAPNSDLLRDPRSEKKLIDEALRVARKSDVIIMALGESADMSGESCCRADIAIPEVQRELLSALLETKKPMVLVLFAGRAISLVEEDANIPAILNVWFGGSEAAYAIGDVLFGDIIPCGKLPVTFPRTSGQIPLYYNHKNTGRPLDDGNWFEKYRSNYLDVPNDPLYPFGYGLSYTRFEYGDLQLNRKSIDKTETITAGITVQNKGLYDGYEVVQLYLRDMVGSITRPVKELKGFQRIFLKAGESTYVRFEITPEMLKFYNDDLEYICEPGEFQIMIGGNSRDVMTASFYLTN